MIQIKSIPFEADYSHNAAPALADISNLTRLFSGSRLSAGLAMFERSVCGCGEGAQPFAIHRDNHWAYIGHEPECRFAVFTERSKMEFLALDEVGGARAQVGSGVAKCVGEQDSMAGTKKMALSPDRQPNTQTRRADFGIFGIEDGHRDSFRVDGDPNTIAEAGGGATLCCDAGASGGGDA